MDPASGRLPADEELVALGAAAQTRVRTEFSTDMMVRRTEEVLLRSAGGRWASDLAMTRREY